MAVLRVLALVVASALFGSSFVEADEAVEAVEAVAAAEPEEADETKALLKQLTISMVAEVLDYRTFQIRDTEKKGNKVIRLGNIAAPEKGSLSDDAYAAKLEAAKEALAKQVGKQMIWWKAAPEESQKITGDESMVLADAWLINGHHIATALKKDKHVVESKEYETELGKNILTAQADEDKKESYKKLEEALKESEKEKARIAKAERDEKAKELAEKVEPLGLAGWIGLATLIGVVALGFMFGGGKKKKTNLNKPKTFWEKTFSKAKGA